MPTPLRYVPQDAKIWKDGKGRPIAVVEMTIRTLLGLFLLKLTTRNASLILGVLGRAKEQHDFSWTDSGIARWHGDDRVERHRPQLHRARDNQPTLPGVVSRRGLMAHGHECVVRRGINQQQCNLLQGYRPGVT